MYVFFHYKFPEESYLKLNKVFWNLGVQIWYQKNGFFSF